MLKRVTSEWLTQQAREGAELDDSALSARRPTGPPLTGPCDECGAPGADLVEDPYMKDVFDESRETYLCHACYRKAIEEI